MKAALLLVLLGLWSVEVLAHKPSDSYLTLTSKAQTISAQWDIALRDLDYAVGLDVNADRKVTWGELRQRQADIFAYVLARLSVNAHAQNCPLQAGDLLADNHSDGGYAVLMFQANCPAPPDKLAIRYQLFFDLDAQHRGLLKLIRGARVDSAIFSPTEQRIEFHEARAWNPWRELGNFAYEGIWHIWMGYDHILFLLSLILPAAMLRVGRQWQAGLHFSRVFWDVFKVVGAFTLAHSITLSLAVLGYVALPSRWVESAIALSVILAALNNIFPVFNDKRTLIAFGFGLIHGFGIAGVLNGMHLPDSQRLLGLGGFNAGVEIGQLAIVGLALPLIIVLSKRRYYPKAILTTGSLIIILIALLWLLERSLDIVILQRDIFEIG